MQNLKQHIKIIIIYINNIYIDIFFTWMNLSFFLAKDGGSSSSKLVKNI